MARLVQRLGLTRYEADEHYKQALEAYKVQKLDEAILQMDEAIRLLPTNPEYYAARGFFYLEDDVKDKAQADFETALKQYPYETLALYGLGSLAYFNKRWDEAIQHFTLAHRADPNRPETLYYLALAHHRNQQNPQGLQYMQQALSLFEALKDKRRTDAGKWVKKLEELAEKQQSLPAGADAPALAPISLPDGQSS